MDYRLSPIVDRLLHRARRAPPFGIDFVIVCLLFVVTLVLYGPSLTYPFVWQDATDIVHAIKRSPAELLTGVESHPYYRPVSFLIWKWILSHFGSDSAWVLHASLVSAHLLNATLLYALARDLMRHRMIAAAAGFVFATYPFSYQAVTWTIAQQPPSLTFALAAILVYIRARLANRTWLFHLMACLSLATAMLLHESAFVGAGVVLAAEAYLLAEHRVPRPQFWPAVYVLSTLAMLVLYSSVATARPPATPLDPLTGAYILQSLTYPTAMGLARFCQAGACDSLSWLWTIGGLTLLGLLLAWRSGRTLRIGAFGLAWFGLGIAPIWARLDYVYYVQYGARLFYFAGSGAALAMAALAGISPKSRSGMLRIGAIVATCAIGGQFVIARQPLYAAGVDLINQTNQALFAEREGLTVFVDSVELIAHQEREFPLGWFGVFVAPWHNRMGEVDHLRAENAEWAVDPTHAQSMQARSTLALELHGNVLAPEHFRELFARAGQVYRAEAFGAQFHLFQIAQIDHLVVGPERYLAEWIGPVRLVAASIEREAGWPVLNLEWSIGGQTEAGLTAFVHVRNAAGEVVAQADGDLVGGLVPFDGWATGDRIRERRLLILPTDRLVETYTVSVGLYDRASLRRAEPTRVVGASTVDDSVIVARVTYPFESAR
jgi:hypothetical protein